MASIWKECPECYTTNNHTGDVSRYCEEHRCKAVKSNGQQCKLPGDADRGFEYCQLHGCEYFYSYAWGEFGVVRCMSRKNPNSDMCDEHEGGPAGPARPVQRVPLSAQGRR